MKRIRWVILKTTRYTHLPTNSDNPFSSIEQTATNSNGGNEMTWSKHKHWTMASDQSNQIARWVPTTEIRCWYKTSSYIPGIKGFILVSIIWFNIYNIQYPSGPAPSLCPPGPRPPHPDIHKHFNRGGGASTQMQNAAGSFINNNLTSNRGTDTVQSAVSFTEQGCMYVYTGQNPYLQVRRYMCVCTLYEHTSVFSSRIRLGPI